MTQKKSNRIHFIDFARGIAIIMMLQGHFISLTLEDYDLLTSSTHSNENLTFSIWLMLRGFTAPLFFTVSGMVFAFTLMKMHEMPFYKNIRVIKGLKRAVALIIIGYLLQLNVSNIDYYLAGKLNERFFAFHVLNSIGLGLIILIFIYVLFIKTLKLNSVISYLFFAFSFLILSVYITSIEGYFPSESPVIIQNVLKGPNSIFPLVPWVSYILVGAALGSFLYQKRTVIKGRWFPLLLATACLIILQFMKWVMQFVEYLTHSELMYLNSQYVLTQLMYITLFISLLIYLEKLLKPDMILLKMGQNTLTIYVLHVILLYGAVIGIGIRSWFEHSLSFTEAIFGAVLFIVFFGILTYFQKALNVKWMRLR